MKGHKNEIIISSHNASVAEERFTPNGNAVTSFRAGVGGSRERGIEGVFFRFNVWGEENAKSVLEVLGGETGLAFIAHGYPKQTWRERDVNGNRKVYINNDLSVTKLFVQLKKSDKKLKEINLVKGGNNQPQPKFEPERVDEDDLPGKEKKEVDE